MTRLERETLLDHSAHGSAISLAIFAGRPMSYWHNGENRWITLGKSEIAKLEAVAA